MLSMQPLKFFLLVELGLPEKGMPPNVIFEKKKKVGLEVIKVSELAHIENANSTFSL